MTAAVTILFDGLAYAVLLFIVSVGLSITMGLMGFVNLAHGAFAMVGGYATVTLMNDLGVPFLPALGIAFLLAGGLSVPIERLVYRPLYDKDELDQVLLTIGLVFMATALVTFAWGPLAARDRGARVPDRAGGPRVPYRPRLPPVHHRLRHRAHRGPLARARTHPGRREDPALRSTTGGWRNRSGST